MQTTQTPTTSAKESPRLDFSRIAQDLQVRKSQVETVVDLLDAGNTIPFITRYRKEATGGLDEEAIRQIQRRAQQLRQLHDRKQSILKSIEAHGQLSPELRKAILHAETNKRLEDLYLPFKPKKRTLATVARERGLEPLADAIWHQDPAVRDLDELLPTLVCPEKELHSTDDVVNGVTHLLAERIGEMAHVRAPIRFFLWDSAKLQVTKSPKMKESAGIEFRDYFEHSESARIIPPHRILAINRGERAKVLQVKLDFDAERARRLAWDKLGMEDHVHEKLLQATCADALQRLILPSLEREIRRELKEVAEEHAVNVFARNLSSLLLAPPLRNRRVLAIDPGFRSGCKIAALDETGSLLEHGVIFPHVPQQRSWQAKCKLEVMIRKHNLAVIAIGNGTACRETEEVVSELIADLASRDWRGEPARPEPKVEPPKPEEPKAEEASPTAESSEQTSGDETAAPVEEAPAAAKLPSETAEASTAATESIDGKEQAATQSESVDVPPVEETPPKEATVTSAEVSAESDKDEQSPDSVTEQETTSAATVETPPQPEGTTAEKQEESEKPASSEKKKKAKPPAERFDLASLPPASAELAYVIVNEAGASVYSVNLGREELPDHDATTRGTVSIGRRLQDPLSELVKIDPQSIGVGLYQHDVNDKFLKDSLDDVVESCVNTVGVDVNTAGVPLLRYVSGLNQLVAQDLVRFREEKGAFRTRAQLLEVPGIGQSRFVQAAGFLKIYAGDDPLDQTWIHPESYEPTQKLLEELGFDSQALNDKIKVAELREKLKKIAPREIADRLELGEPTCRDVLESLARPGRDPRDDLPPPIFRKGILKLDDLTTGMELRGSILNVVDFGAFVDIGLKDSGLVHVSQMANRFVKNPYEVVSVGDVVKVWVMAVDPDRHRVSLSMLPPGTEREKPQRERGGERRDERRQERPPRERRDDRPPREGGETKDSGERRPPLRGERAGQGRGRGGPRPDDRSETALPRRGERRQGGESKFGARRPRGKPREGEHSGRQESSQERQEAPPPRRPQRKPPKPKLTQAALEGEAPLGTFAELAAFWTAKETKKEEPAEAPAQAETAPAQVDEPKENAEPNGPPDQPEQSSAAEEQTIRQPVESPDS